MSAPGVPPGADVFSTLGLRARVLEAWAASPARFREDANAEEDLALGAYRDRLVVELAQNAADASARAGRGPGRLLLRLAGDVLVAANTGEPLDAPGVEALSTLRASAKRGHDTVGRFGVGFAAVLAVTDEPQVLSRTGGVRWSKAEAQALVRQVPSLADELGRRGGALPVLRLPFPAESDAEARAVVPPGYDTAVVPPGYDTAVVLPLRDGAAHETARRALDEVDAALLLTLPALGEVVIEVAGVRRVLRAERDGPEPDADVLLDDDGRTTRWRLTSASGRVDPALLADRPTEERARRTWAMTCAVPVDDAGTPVPMPDRVPGVVHAPTPTDEPLGLPVLLVASFPLDPSRRHVAGGPLREFLVDRCAEVYTTLVERIATGPAVLTMVPGPLPSGALDGALREAVRARLAETPIVAAAEPGRPPLRPRDAVLLGGGLRDAAAPERLAAVLPGMVAPAWCRRHDQVAALRALGVREVRLADLVDGLAGLSLDPPDWCDLYAALDGAEPEALGALPVPLADGRVVRGPRGLLLTPADALDRVDVASLSSLGVRVVDPEAAHPLLERLGAVPATPRTLLDDPTVRAAVASSYDEDDPAPVAEAVLGLVRAAGVRPGEETWLADLALPGDDGDWYPAGELLLPDSPLAAVVAKDAPFGTVETDLVARWGADTLEAVGVLRTFAVVREHDVPLDAATCDHHLDGEDEWLDDVLGSLPRLDAPPVLGELLAVRDLELVDPEQWPTALRLLGEPPLRAAVLTPARLALVDGRRVEARPYTAWWLARQPVLGGRRPSDLRLGDDDRLVGLYDEAPADIDEEMLRALGVRSTVETLLAERDGPDDLLRRLADPGRAVRRDRLRRLYVALAAVPPERVDPPDAVRAVRAGEVVVVDAEDALVVDAPDLLPLAADRALLLAPLALADALADLLAVPVASEVLAGEVSAAGQERPVPDAVHEALAAAAPTTWHHHDRLLVDGREVAWRVVDGTVHASTPDGLARGLAWATGGWERRHELAALLREPEQADDLRAEAELDGLSD